MVFLHVTLHYDLYQFIYAFTYVTQCKSVTSLLHSEEFAEKALPMLISNKIITNFEFASHHHGVALCCQIVWIIGLIRLRIEIIREPL